MRRGSELLTFALQTLPQEAPEQGPTVVTERGDLVVVDTELVRHVDAEPLGAHLQDGKTQGHGQVPVHPGELIAGPSTHLGRRYSHCRWQTLAWL